MTMTLEEQESDRFGLALANVEEVRTRAGKRKTKYLKYKSEIKYKESPK